MAASWHAGGEGATTRQLSNFAVAPPYFDTVTHLVQQGNPQWGIVHETGNYPGAWWLMPYQFWYEVPAIADYDNADLLVVAIMLVIFAGILLLPVIPGLNRLPHGLQGLSLHLARLVPGLRRGRTEAAADRWEAMRAVVVCQSLGGNTVARRERGSARLPPR